MSIPDFQTLMRPVLQAASSDERAIADVITEMSDLFHLSEDERSEMLPSGRQARMANRVHWARTYLKQSGLVRPTRRGHFEITDRGQQVLVEGPERITMKFLEKFEDYREFQSRSRGDAAGAADELATSVEEAEQTPDEILRSAYATLRAALAEELVERLRDSAPDFFERVIVEVLLAMGYGATQDSGTVLGRTGDNGVDGVIDKDRLGVDQVYVQAKRYGAATPVGPSEIRDFFGALSLKNVSQGIFVTTSRFSAQARETADRLGARIVLVDGERFAQLMIDYEVGCRVRQVFKVAEFDESYFP